MTPPKFHYRPCNVRCHNVAIFIKFHQNFTSSPQDFTHYWSVFNLIGVIVMVNTIIILCHITYLFVPSFFSYYVDMQILSNEKRHFIRRACLMLPGLAALMRNDWWLFLKISVITFSTCLVRQATRFFIIIKISFKEALLLIFSLAY